MPTAINNKLISWASDIDPGTIPPVAGLPDRVGIPGTSSRQMRRPGDTSPIK